MQFSFPPIFSQSLSKPLIKRLNPVLIVHTKHVERILLTTHLINRKRALAKTGLALFVLCILALSAMAPMVKAQANGAWAAIQLNPTEGQPGSSVSLTGTGFTGNVLIYFGTGTSPSLALVGTTSSTNSNGAISVFFQVPPESPGSYIVTAQDSAGDSAQSSFIVISGPSSPPTSSPSSSSSTSGSSSSSTSSGSTYYPYPIVTSLPKSAGFWSTPTIAAVIVIVALAAVVSAFLLQRTRSKREMLLKKEPLSYQPQSPMQTSRPNETPRYGQSPPYSQSRYNQPSSQSSSLSPYAQRYSQQTTEFAMTKSMTSSSSGQQLTSGKTCPHCKRIVKADYSICPYCNKKLK